MQAATLSAAAIAQFIDGLSKAIDDRTIPSQQLLLLLALYTYGQMSQGALSQHTGVAASSNSRNIAKLGAGELMKPGHGLVESFDDLADRRNKMVRLTPKGMAIMKALLPSR